MSVVITTDSVEPGARVEYWRGHLAQLFGGDYRIEPCPGTPFRAGLSSYSVGALTITELSGTPFAVLRDGGTDNAGLHALLQIEGRCVVSGEGWEAVVAPGNFCLMSSRQKMRAHLDEPFRCILLWIPESRLGDLRADWQHFTTAYVPARQGIAAVFVDAVKSLLQHGDELERQNAHSVCDSIITLLGATLKSVAEDSGTISTRMEIFHKERIRNFIQQNLNNPSLDVAFIARSIGLSPRYIHRLFSTEPLRLMQTVWAERLDSCYRDLVEARTAKRPISDVAYSWGFNDQAHFSRAFRKRFGTSPRNVRTKLPEPRQE
ncbi:helix-turn-helix domain-containing protein [Herbaspirillum sp. HC18]|nr:helix-turn-helix domain-containing protein [Herbaspirillum sp. HC18]